MVKHQHLFPWYLIVRRWVAVFLITTAVVTALMPGPAEAQKRQNTTKVALDGNTRFLFFNLTQAGTYEILKNGASFDSRTGSPSGSVVFTDVTTVGDQYTLTLTGVEPVDPSALATTSGQLGADTTGHILAALWIGLALILALGGGVLALRWRRAH